MADRYFDFVVHGGDYNPDQWIKTKEIWDEDMRLMKLAHINSATISIFSWSVLEPEENVYNFEWLDEIMDKMHENGISAILATPSGARPAWLAEKYPEVLRIEENGIRNEFGVRHNHCLTSPVYREKVSKINRLLAERYRNHPALKMWHISNEYSGECHCELCQNAFREWLKEYYHNDIDELNDKWWNGFWSHNFNSFEQISSPKNRGENHVSALKLAWYRFVTAQHISFYENEIKPLRELTPDIPITTNLMRGYDGIDYHELAKHLDLVSWDNYTDWVSKGKEYAGNDASFWHDVFRGLKGGKPFFMMESTPSLVNWFDVNKLLKSGIRELEDIEALAHGSDSVQYFQWRKARGGHEKYHGAVVDHCGHENTRVFRDVSATGEHIEKLSEIVGTRCNSKAAIIFDYENMWAVKHYCGYNNLHREYKEECKKWHRPFFERGISTDVISSDDDFSKYDIIIAPYLYMLKDGVKENIKKYVENGGVFVTTYLFGCVDKDDRCFLGGFPANELKDVFGVWAEETDSLPDGMSGKAIYKGKEYSVDTVCDLIHAKGSEILGEYASDFYSGTPAVTVNSYGKGRAYYTAFCNNGDFTDDFVNDLINEYNITPDADIIAPKGVTFRKRGNLLFVFNFNDEDKEICFNGEYTDVITGETVKNKATVKGCGYIVLK